MRRYVATCRAREERARIQARDTLFRENNRSRFNSSNPRSECKGLRISDNICTDPQEIVSHFRNYFKELATSSQSQSSSLTEAESIIPDLEISSFLNCENILDTEVELEEIEGALRTLKLGKSGGIDSLDPEHIYLGWATLSLWLKKNFNRIIVLEQIPGCFHHPRRAGRCAGNPGVAHQGCPHGDWRRFWRQDSTVPGAAGRPAVQEGSRHP